MRHFKTSEISKLNGGRRWISLQDAAA